ncbi:hypothetical protein GM921_11370 [Pedobacter sp. LMG 31464]|uniref:Uncharacterized protein n=1 Tax=Pedobacter planticolens TaxID=2679964 RepID=A0A923DXX4_9SPHI|nr:hypothetical protein [Pedobacter planticolens]MBB2146087.1 hypothetical protein [Pedobacter planticolens]
MERKIIGVWESDLLDQPTRNSIGNIVIEFTADGKLTYKIVENKKMHIINMIYHVIGDTIFSNQPSNPQEEKTKFEFKNDDRLLLKFDGEITIFKRIE